MKTTRGTLVHQIVQNSIENMQYLEIRRYVWRFLKQNKIRKNDKNDMSSKMRKKRQKTKCIDKSLEIVSLSLKSKT
jgi:hypothetical protein